MNQRNGGFDRIKIQINVYPNFINESIDSLNMLLGEY